MPNRALNDFSYALLAHFLCIPKTNICFCHLARTLMLSLSTLLFTFCIAGQHSRASVRSAKREKQTNARTLPNKVRLIVSLLVVGLCRQPKNPNPNPDPKPNPKRNSNPCATSELSIKNVRRASELRRRDFFEFAYLC